LAIEEFLRGHRQSLDGEDLLGSVHHCGDGSIGLICREAIGLGDKLLDFRGLHRRGLLRVLDIGNPLVVVVSDASKSLAQTIDRVRALLKGAGFHVVFLSQIEMVFLSLLEPGYKVVDRMPLIPRRQLRPLTV
jgi:hypothetical protein